MDALWKGRLGSDPHAAIDALNRSLPFDRRLWQVDIRGSVAWATMLGETGILPAVEAEKIVEGLKGVEAGLADGRYELPPNAEDIHTAIEWLLYSEIGELAGKLHTGRSRNDQVATDTRLYTRELSEEVVGHVRDLQRVLVELAERETGVLLPGMTHLQHAQPVLLSHHLLAYFWMFERDISRFQDARRRADVLPLGSAAMAGSGYPVDRVRLAELLGFSRPSENSLDAVSDRDFILDFLSSAAIFGVHLSRLGEEMVLWNSQEFGWIELSDDTTTGSSIMPQKKNPDVAELARGKSGRLIGSLIGLLTTMKGLPLAYNKDTQEDKEPLFDAGDTLCLVLPAMTLTLRQAKFRTEKMRAALVGDFSTATDLADALAKAGIPFREAHHAVGAEVRARLESGQGLEGLANFESSGRSVSVDLTPEGSVRNREVLGGTGPDAVRVQLQAAKAILS